jgi:ClpP class serine protease
VDGVPELSSEIYNSRGKKKMLAVANGMAASAAYWIGTAADELWVTCSGDM